MKRGTYSEEYDIISYGLHRTNSGGTHIITNPKQIMEINADIRKQNGASYQVTTMTTL